MTQDDQRIEEISHAAEALIAGPPEFLRAFVGDEAGARAQRRSILIASLRDQEYWGRVGVSVDDLGADLEAVLRYRGHSVPDDVRAEIVEVLRQLDGWQAVDGGLAPERAERDGLRRRVERDYALARSLRVFLPRWDEVQRLLRRRYISLSANYFAQAIAALDTLLEELKYEDTDPLRCHTAWQSLGQALHGINTETRDFARELRALRVDGNHPEVLAEVADRLGVLHEKFFRVAAEGAAKVRERLEKLRDERHSGENVSRLQDALRLREEEWSVSIGETDAERDERISAVGWEVLRELDLFDRFMADSGPGSWREGAKIISLALVDLTERIHAAISLRLQQTQAITALLRRARDLAEGGEDATQRARHYLWNASGAIHAAVWLHKMPASDDQVRLERWLAQRGGSPLPMVDEETWRRSIRPRFKPDPPPPPPELTLADDWDPGDDPRIREAESARARLVERLIAAGSAANLDYLESFAELRILAQLLWLPRNSAPLRRLGLHIQPAGAGMQARAWVRGPGFDLEMDNYRFTATTANAQKVADAIRMATEAARRLAEADAMEEPIGPASRKPPEPVPAFTLPPVEVEEDDSRFITRPLYATDLETPTHGLPVLQPAASSQGMPSARVEPEPRKPRPASPSRRPWPLGGLIGRREPTRQGDE
ncbi:MAG TPA: hypothetical protein VF807_01530 [Ktedonobacterales bacterium]